jgi:hypothetical protein
MENFHQKCNTRKFRTAGYNPWYKNSWRSGMISTQSKISRPVLLTCFSVRLVSGWSKFWSLILKSIGSIPLCRLIVIKKWIHRLHNNLMLYIICWLCWLGRRRYSILKISVHDKAQQGCNMVIDWHGATIKWRLVKKTQRIECDKCQLKLQIVNKKPFKVELKAPCWEANTLMFKIVVLHEIVLNYWL